MYTLSNDIMRLVSTHDFGGKEGREKRRLLAGNISNVSRTKTFKGAGTISVKEIRCEKYLFQGLFGNALID